MCVETQVGFCGSLRKTLHVCRNAGWFLSVFVENSMCIETRVGFCRSVQKSKSVKTHVDLCLSGKLYVHVCRIADCRFPSVSGKLYRWRDADLFLMVCKKLLVFRNAGWFISVCKEPRTYVMHVQSGECKQHFFFSTNAGLNLLQTTPRERQVDLRDYPRHFSSFAVWK